MQRVGIMGGTFDPIHLAHLAAAEAARMAFSLERVIFVPAGIPPHKSDNITPGKVRLEMALAATAANPNFVVSDFEVVKPGKSYTIDTIAHFRSLFGEQGEIFFITGADAILQILSWRDVKRLMEMCWFIAVTRPGYAHDGLKVALSGLPEYVKKRISVLGVPAMAISSTQVRQRVRQGLNINDLVPDEVAALINKYNLYR